MCIFIIQAETCWSNKNALMITSVAGVFWHLQYFFTVKFPFYYSHYDWTQSDIINKCKVTAKDTLQQKQIFTALGTLKKAKKGEKCV